VQTLARILPPLARSRRTAKDASMDVDASDEQTRRGA